MNRIPRTIVAFGDSITHGAEFPPEERWTTLVESRLREAGIVARVVNAGIGGNTTGQGLERIETDVLAHNPDLVLIEFGFNDCHIPEANAPRTTMADFRWNQRRIGQLTRQRTNADLVYIANHPTLVFDLKTDGRPYEIGSQVYNRITREVAQELDADLLNMHHLFGRRGTPLGALLSPDNLHLSAAGNREYAMIVSDFLLTRYRS